MTIPACKRTECPFIADCPWGKVIADKCPMYDLFCKMRQATDKVVNLQAQVAAQKATIKILKKKLEARETR